MKYLLVGLSLLLLGCGPEKNQGFVTRPKSTPPPLTLSGELTRPNTILFDRDGSGRRLLEVSGGRVNLQPGSVPLGILGTRATLYHEGKPILVVTAAQVHFDTERKQLLAQGGVSAQSLDQADPKRFQCDTLTWHPGTKRVIGEGHVAAHYGTLGEVYGSRLETDLQLKTLDLLP